MSGSMLEKYGLRPSNRSGVNDQPDESDRVGEFSCFGWLRGARERSVMLELIRKDGHTLGIGYAWIHEMEYDPAGRIVLHAGERTITISGRNLNHETRPNVRLFSALTRHRVLWVREMDEHRPLDSDDSITMIDSIEW